MSNNLQNLQALCSQGLMGRLLQDSQQEWKQFVMHPFVKELEVGTLPEKSFRHFLIQDYLYLLDYSRVEALAIYKSHDFNTMMYFFNILKGLLEVELPLHLSYCQKWGINTEGLEQVPRTIELIAYSQYLLNKSMQGDLLDIVVLLLPCLIGYGEVGLRLVNAVKSSQVGNPYASWINVYSGSEYIELVRNALQFLEKIAIQYGAEQRYSMILDEFKMVVNLETTFWDMGLKVSLG